MGWMRSLSRTKGLYQAWDHFSEITLPGMPSEVKEAALVAARLMGWRIEEQPDGGLSWREPWSVLAWNVKVVMRVSPAGDQSSVSLFGVRGFFARRLAPHYVKRRVDMVERQLRSALDREGVGTAIRRSMWYLPIRVGEWALLGVAVLSYIWSVLSEILGFGYVPETQILCGMAGGATALLAVLRRRIAESTDAGFGAVAGLAAFCVMLVAVVALQVLA
jgi:hypothetical protein